MNEGDGEDDQKDSADQSQSMEHVRALEKARLMTWLRRRLKDIDWLQQKERDLWKHWRARRNGGLVYGEKLSDATSEKEYDIAVVLTGLNDVKDATLPFLTSDSQEEMKKWRQEQKDTTEGYEGQLKNILLTLQERMNLNHKNLESSTTTMSTDTAHDLFENRPPATQPCMELRPIIVLPGLPASIVPVFQWIPLKWFLIPLIRGVDNQKRALSNKYPESVLFVESPGLGSVEQYEAGMGSIQAESVLVLIQNISAKARHKAQTAMDKYYQLKGEAGLQDQNESETEKQYEQAYHQHGASSRPMAFSPRIGSKLFSLDGIHPNDEGYDFYGRYIANAIVSEWENAK